MKKKSVLYILFISFLLVSMLPFATAKIAEGYRHTYDYYAVTFDGEGDAMVSAKFTIRNSQSTLLGTLVLEIPGQIIVYDVTEEYLGRTQKVPKYDLEETDLSDSTVLRINLPEEVQSEQTVSITIMYKISRYAKNTLAGFKFDFPTIIDNNADLIEKVRVAINVDEGLYLKGAGSEVSYKPDFSFGAMQKSAATSEMAVEDYNRYSQSIAYVGGYVKTASNLDPGESFHVKGKYSKSWFGAHLTGVVITILIIAVIVLAITKLVKNSKRRKAQIQKSKPSEEDKENEELEQKVKTLKSKESKAQKIVKSEKKQLSFLQITGIGLTSAVVLYLSYFVAMLFAQAMTHGSYGTGRVIFMLFTLFIFFAFGLIVLFGVPVYIGMKHGFMQGLFIFFSIIAWMLVLFLIVALFLIIMKSFYTYGYRTIA